MRNSRSFILQLILMAITFAFWTWTASQVMSQPTPDANLRELRRLEREVNQLQENDGALRIALENRITKLEAGYAALEAQNDKFQSVGIGAALTLFGLFAGTLWRIISAEHKRKS